MPVILSLEKRVFGSVQNLIAYSDNWTEDDINGDGKKQGLPLKKLASDTKMTAS